MVTFGEVQKEMVKLFNELVASTPIMAKTVTEDRTQSVFSSKKHRLFVDHYPQATDGPEWVGCLVERAYGMFVPGEIKPATRVLMDFRRMPGSDAVTFLGHGYTPDVAEALQDMVNLVKTVLEPGKAIMEHFRTQVTPPDARFTIHFDVRDTMGIATHKNGHYEFSLYRGTISIPQLKINLGFNKDLLVLTPVNIKGTDPIVHRTMDEVLQGVTNNQFTFVKEEIHDV